MISKKQTEFTELVLSGKNVFLTGKAGTGKSFIVKKVIELLKDEGKNVAAIAPTGMAANHIGGQTIHSMFSVNPYGICSFESCNFMRKEKRRLMDKVDVVFIDEVSMLRPDILDAMNWTLIKNDCKSLHTKQIVFVGDLKQLPVVLDDNAKSVLFSSGYKGTLFTDAIIYNDLDVVNLELDEVIRQQDTEFVENLNIIRDGGKSNYFRKFVSTEASGIVLAPHNTTVTKYNELGLESIDSKLYEFEAKVWGNVNANDFNVESKIKVKDGCKIMYLINSKENPLRNGTIGKFVVEKNNFFIEVEGVKYKLDKHEFDKKEYVFNYENKELELQTIGSIKQYPFKLAYALSIHKSQGLTFDEVTVDLSKRCFQDGQMYVALSRVKTPAGLKIIV